MFRFTSIKHHKRMLCQAITNGYAAGIGPSPFFPRLAEIWMWEKMVNMYVGKFKLNCSHYFQFRGN